MFNGETQQPHILCLGLAKCDGACGRMGITYVFDQVIEQVHGVMEIPAVRKFNSKMQQLHVQCSGCVRPANHSLE